MKKRNMLKLTLLALPLMLVGTIFAWTQPETDEADRVTLEGYNLSLYQPNATNTSGIVLAGGQHNKVDVFVVPEGIPVGFDLYMTPQGSSVRFIGSGLGNGDTARVEVTIGISLKATLGSDAETTFYCMTRPYTEAAFTNAVAIEGCKSVRKMPPNDLGYFAISEITLVISDGDLLELSGFPITGITVDIKSLSVRIREVK